jgi:hypothetical protein
VSCFHLAQYIRSCIGNCFRVRSGSRDSSVGAGWTAGVRFPTGARDFSLLHSLQTGSGAHLSNGYQGLLLLRVKRPDREADSFRARNISGGLCLEQHRSYNDAWRMLQRTKTCNSQYCYYLIWKRYPRLRLLTDTH